MNSFTYQESLAISATRALAILLIIVCHILQGIDNYLAWWLNVGVQLFLFISGFLFGQKTIYDWKYWAKKRVQRVIPSFYLLIIILSVLQLLVFRNQDWGKELMYHILLVHGFMNVTIPGAEHLWFISTIALCYLSVPILQNLRGRSIKDAYMLTAIILISFLLMKKLVPQFVHLATVFDLFSFVAGYVIASIYKTMPSQRIISIFSIIAMILIILRAVLQWGAPSESGFYTTVLNLVILCSKPMLAASIFMLLFMHLKRKVFGSGFEKVIRSADEYSYEAYLTHYLFIIGPFSLLFITRNFAFNLLVCLSLSIVSAMTLRHLSSFLVNSLETKGPRIISREDLD